MRTSSVLAGLILVAAACREDSHNPRACAKHEAQWCGQGMICLIIGDQSKCVAAGVVPLDGVIGMASIQNLLSVGASCA